jgi:hypothetical protein
MWFEQVLFFVAGIGALGGALGVVLLPLATLNVLITAVVIVLDDESWWIW